MPIYEYRCAACGHHLEALQKMSEAPLRKCPDCGKSQLKRLVSASQFRLKGSGWYETDFKKKDEAKRNLVEKAGADAGGAASDQSTDAAAKPSEPAAAGKAADAKADGASEKTAAPKPAKPTARKPVKPRAKTARG
jgi:putative FmdB family regulatory protein